MVDPQVQVSADDLRELAEAAGLQAERWRRDGHEAKANVVGEACQRAAEIVSESDLVRIDVSERGFKHYEPIKTEYGHIVRIYESSAAMKPCLWLSIEEEAAHLAPEHIDAVINALITARDNHYQNE